VKKERNKTGLFLLNAGIVGTVIFGGGLILRGLEVLYVALLICFLLLLVSGLYVTFIKNK
jgi:hypothetical protein